jgi:hypothetical protein
MKVLGKLSLGEGSDFHSPLKAGTVDAQSTSLATPVSAHRTPKTRKKMIRDASE